MIYYQINLYMRFNNKIQEKLDFANYLLDKYNIQKRIIENDKLKNE